MTVPARVRRGTTGSDWYYFDGVNPMTILGGGVGGTLQTRLGVAAVNDMTTAEFDALQQYLLNRKAAFDSLAACHACPVPEPEFTTEADEIVNQLTGGGG